VIMVRRRSATIRSAALCIDQWKRRMAGHQNQFMYVSPGDRVRMTYINQNGSVLSTSTGA
jgi:hypothetical protein